MRGALIMMVLLLVGCPFAPREAFAATPAGPGMPYFVRLTALEGAPKDSLAAAAFSSGFRGAFSDESFRAERMNGSRATPAAAVTNRFRMLESMGAPDDSAGDSYHAQVTLDWLRNPPPPRGMLVAPARPGVRITWFTLTPEAVAAGARVIPTRVLLKFEVGTPPAEMGRQVALLVLESLHHLSGDLDEDVRLALGNTLRLPAPAR
jgi:hypothetical protein